MTYDEIKDKYPLGCEVECHQVFPNYPSWGEVYKRRYFAPQGKILAILDPKKHGPKCLLFKIEKPEGRKISRESAQATILRKIVPFVRFDHWLYHAVGDKRFVLVESSHIEEAFQSDHGLLKWLTPSEVKERVDTLAIHKPRTLGPTTTHPPNVRPKPIEIPDTMNDRTEQLKRILKPGMRVKLKETTEGNWDLDEVGFIGIADEDLGKWIEIGAVNEYHFFGSERFVFPLTMIDKVEGEEENHAEFGRYETIPVPREKVKEWVKDASEDPFRQKGRLEELCSALGNELLDTLLQEIEEEEKYVSLKWENEEGKKQGVDRKTNEVAAHLKSKGIMLGSNYEVEIKEEKGGTWLYFKREG